MAFPFGDTVPLGQARDWLRAHVDRGEHCPCCTQYAKVYRRKLNTAMAVTVIELARAAPPGAPFVHLPTLLQARVMPRVHNLAGDASKPVYWALIEEEAGEREDGGRAGGWRVTRLGLDWIKNRATVPKYALVYDGRVLGLDGPPWGIADALGTRFDLRDLMDGI